MFKGYWVSPKGEVLDLGSKTHIQVVIENPKKFGETAESIQRDYDARDEKMNWEGEARNEIMIRIIKRGWARIRERSNQWTVQVDKLTPKMNDVLWMWANTISKTVHDKYAPVLIYDLGSMKSKGKSIDFIDLSSGKSVSENVNYNTKHFKIVNDVNALSDITYPPEFDYHSIDSSINKYLK